MCDTSVVQVQVCYTSKAIGPKAHNKTQYTLTSTMYVIIKNGQKTCIQEANVTKKKEKYI